VLLRVYRDPAVVRSIAEDPEGAPIPDAHKVVFRWTGKLVKQPWTLGADDIAQLRGLGLSERAIAHWAARGASQSWFTMCADGAGVDLDGGALAGPAVGRDRGVYEGECRPETKDDLGCAKPGSTERRSDSAWIETLEQGEAFEFAAQRATERWGCVPHILRAVSLLPEWLDRHAYMLQLLERPQSELLPAWVHARVRARVAELNRSVWAKPTIDALLARHAPGPGHGGRIDELALTLATKLVEAPWKVTEKDAIAFRDAGLDDAAYLDVLDTTAIQNALDRLSFALGVPADSGPRRVPESDGVFPQHFHLRSTGALPARRRRSSRFLTRVISGKFASLLFRLRVSALQVLPGARGADERSRRHPRWRPGHPAGRPHLGK